jgi:hypothetical protein
MLRRYMADARLPLVAAVINHVMTDAMASERTEVRGTMTAMDSVQTVVRMDSHVRDAETCRVK